MEIANYFQEKMFTYREKLDMINIINYRIKKAEKLIAAINRMNVSQAKKENLISYKTREISDLNALSEKIENSTNQYEER